MYFEDGGDPYRSRYVRREVHVKFVDLPRARPSDAWVWLPLLVLGVVPFVVLALVGMRNPVELGLGAALTLVGGARALRELRPRR